MNRGVFPFTLFPLDVALSIVFFIELQNSALGPEGVCLTSGMRNSIVREKVNYLYQMFACVSSGYLESPAEKEMWISVGSAVCDGGTICKMAGAVCENSGKP